MMISDSKPVLVYSGPEEGADTLKAVVGNYFDVLCVPPETGAVAQALERANAFLDASMKVKISGAMIRAALRLKVIAAATTGADHIDQDELAKAGVPLLTLRGQAEVLQKLTPAAEHSWLLLMACARRLCPARDDVIKGRWDRERFPGILLRGKTLGIIGCGRIGKWMARYAEAFGMTCQGYDPYLAEWPSSIKRVELEELLANSDFITLHVNLSEETRGLLDRSRIKHFKPGCVFINTSRGDLVDEEGLLEALQSGRIAAAGLDVLSGEPDIQNHPLRQYALEHDNLIITPHIGGFCPEAVRVVVQFSAERIMRHFDTLVR